jgi:hypothetical protein
LSHCHPDYCKTPKEPFGQIRKMCPYFKGT